ncbi:hypothetical protein [Flavobacterium sp. CAN_S2]|uniref:hypothetical protein n=1 Tax=Flavobacterium sp. CAN_S2 TaxID=2787726 RepID=UPI0018CB9009
MALYDLQVREELLKEGRLSPDYYPEMKHVHKKNAERLDEIINSIGYPTKSIAGEEASQGHCLWYSTQSACLFL